MARDSKIEWTDHTFNPWWGCTKVSPACDHCYAEAWARRMGLDVWTAGKPRRFLSDAYWWQPHRWNEAAKCSGKRSRIFLRFHGHFAWSVTAPYGDDPL